MSEHTDCCSSALDKPAGQPHKHTPPAPVKPAGQCCGHDHGHEHEAKQHHSHDHQHDHGHDHKHDHEHAHQHKHGHGHADHHHHGAACSGHHAAASSPPAVVPEGAQRTRLHISAMDCPTEEALIRRSLGEMPHVLGLDFDLLNRILTIHHRELDLDAVHKRLQSLGMAGKEIADDKTPVSAPAIDRGLRWRVAAGTLLALASEVLAWITGSDQSFMVAGLALAAITVCGLPTLKKGWIALRHFTLNIHLLMTAAVAGAFALGQWPEAAMVICLFALAEMIEAASLIRARDAISGLISQAPENALVQQSDGSWLAVATADIPLDAIVQCRPGDRIALDGVVENGRSAVNQAAITGESLPVEKAAGDTVYAGSLNQSGSLQIRVSALAGSSMLARIAQSVQQAQSQRAPTQGFVDRFAAIYTPVVFAVAVLLALIPPLLLGQGWHDSIYRALVLLVIACPCALVISTPVTVVSGLALAARRGIVIKGGAFLEQAKALRFLALDKTGTLTEGRPALQRVHSFSTLSEPAILRIAAALEAHSSHPIAHAILEAHNEPATTALQVQLIEHGQTRGIEGEVDGQFYALGNHTLPDTLGMTLPAGLEQRFRAAVDEAEQSGQTVILLCDRQQLLGMLTVADTIRPATRAAVSELSAMGVSCMMLTGDQPKTAAAIGAQAGLSDIRAALLPEDKLRIVGELAASGVTGMTGDGINDAPALARAHLGLAMAGGSDTALETADVALMNNDLRQIPELIRISRQTGRVLKQNIAFALIVKLVFFVLALSGHASLWMAVFADTGTSLLVVFNGLRLLRYQAATASSD